MSDTLSPEGAHQQVGASSLTLGDLLALAARLVEPGNVHQILARVADLLVPSMGDYLAAYLVEGDLLRRTVTRSTNAELRPDAAEGEMALDEGSPLHTALRTRRPELLREVPAEVLGRVHPDGGLLAGLPDGSRQSIVYLPLLGPKGSVGVLMVGANDRQLDPELVDGATALARSVGHAVATASAGEVEADVGRALRSATVLDRLPQVDGYELAAFSLVEGKRATAGLGGDWYDVLALPSGQIGFVVGDVVGHGTEAVAAMASYRAALRAYLFDDHSPAKTLARLNTLAYSLHPGRLASVVVGTLDPTTGEVRLSRAGHPPPVLAGGRLELRPAAKDPLIGVVPDREFAQFAFELAPGQVLLMYTDGLVERRDRPLDAGVIALAERADAWAAEDAKALCRKLEDESRLDPDRTDDATVLALGRTPSRPHRYVESLPAEASSASLARRRAGAWLRRAKVEPMIVADAELAITELVANAVEAGVPGAPIGLAVALDDYRVTIAVTNVGEPFTPPDVNAAEPLRERGRGIKMIKALADRFDVDHSDGATTVSCAIVRKDD